MRPATLLLLLLLPACVGDRTAPPDEDAAGLPAMRVESSAAFAAEEHAVRYRFDEAAEDLPANVAEAEPGDACLLLAPTRARAAGVLNLAFGIGTRLYLAGRRPDGSVGALPLLVDPETEDLLPRLGADPTARDLADHFGSEGVLDLRVERRGDVVRYRWGHPRDLPGATPFDEGDVTLPVAEVEAAGEGPLLPTLAATFERRRAARKGDRTWVRLEVSDDATVVDLLRAVECAGGGTEALFVPPIELRQPLLEVLRLPEPAEEDADALAEDDGASPRTIVFVPRILDSFPGPRFRIRGRDVTLDEIACDRDLLLSVDREIPFAFVRPLVAKARKAGVGVQLAFPRAEFGWLFERVLRVPPAGSDPVDVPLAGAVDEGFDPAGRGVRLLVPDDATAGDVWRATLHVLRRGAAGVDYAPAG